MPSTVCVLPQYVSVFSKGRGGGGSVREGGGVRWRLRLERVVGEDGVQKGVWLDWIGAK